MRGGENITYTLAEFKEHINKREFKEVSRHYKRLFEKIGPYIDESNVKYFYARNLFNKEAEKEFIFFTEKHIVFVNFQREEKYFVKCVPVSSGEISIELPEYVHLGISLSFKNGGEELLSLHSLNDSSERWNEEYIESIQDIHKLLLAL